MEANRKPHRSGLAQAAAFPFIRRDCDRKHAQNKKNRLISRIKMCLGMCSIPSARLLARYRSSSSPQDKMHLTVHYWWVPHRPTQQVDRTRAVTQQVHDRFDSIVVLLFGAKISVLHKCIVFAIVATWKDWMSRGSWKKQSSSTKPDCLGFFGSSPCRAET